MLDSIWLIPLLPIVGVLVNGFWGRRMSLRAVGLLASATVGLGSRTSVLELVTLAPRRSQPALVVELVLEPRLAVLPGAEARVPLCLARRAATWAGETLCRPRFGSMAAYSSPYLGRCAPRQRAAPNA